MWLFAAVFFVVLVKDVLAHKNELDKSKMGYNVIVSMVANFFDTLGIGSYAIATSAWKFNKAIKDDLIPGTLNVAFGIPICVEATITMTRIEMDSLTLVLMIASAIVGSIIGAKIISRMDIMKIRVVMGVALLLVAVVTLCKINAIGPFGILGTARGLEGGLLVAGVAANFVLGILMTAGIGLYAPCMATCLLLGVDATACFPVFMGSCACLMPACSIEFIKTHRYDVPHTIGNAVGGCIGVFIAWKLVTSLPMFWLINMICLVLVWTSYSLISAANKERKAGAA